jgi:cysteine-S-conjugate beta-lyase
VTNPLCELTLDQLRSRTSVKWRLYPPDVLPLFVAEMDVRLAEPIAAALHEAVDRGDTGYPAGAMYAEALAAFARGRWGWELPLERTRLVPDVMLGVVEVLKLVTGPGDAVVINAPVYAPFYRFIEHMDRRVIEAPLGADHRIDFEHLERAFAAGSDGGRRAAFLLCSPHNPTGTVHTTAELTAVADLATTYGVRVVADEIHAPVVLDGARFVPYLAVSGTDNDYAVLSASKAWNLAGLKAAVAVSGVAAGSELEAMPEEVGHGASHVGVLAHTAALRDGGDWLDSLLAAIDENRRLLVALLQTHLPEVRYQPGEGTYLAWLDCRDLGLGDDPAQVFLDRGRVALIHGPTFGTGGAGHTRMNLATSPEIITEAVRRMVAAVA